MSNIDSETDMEEDLEWTVDQVYRVWDMMERVRSRLDFLEKEYKRTRKKLTLDELIAQAPDA